MRNPQILDEFIELSSIDVISRKERKIIDILKDKLTDIGCSVYEDDAAKYVNGDSGNLLAVLEGDINESVLFAAHVDRVQNGFNIKPVIKQNRIISDGNTVLAADDLSGVCSILDGLRRVKESNRPHPRIEVLFTVCEEIGVLGSKYLDCSKLQSKSGYVLDSPGRIGRVLDSAMGKAELFLTVNGKAAHCAYPELGISATRALILVLSQLEDGRVDSETVINWSFISAPGACNSVPDTASAKAFALSLINDKLQLYIENFLKTAKEVSNKIGAEIEAKYILNYPAFFVPKSANVLKIAERALKNIGIEAKIEHGGGGLDANRLNGYGIECVALSTGYNKNHTVDEYVEIEDLIQSGEMVANIIWEFSK